MVGVVDGGTSYISSHSADVILSDIRPIKLKPEALRAINVLLDEFLSKILSASASLVPDRLRSSLLSLLPTSLGKEALLEAEVELRAYWERTDPTGGGDEDDISTFDLPWAFSLLRLKCEAYSTLNEKDEDPNAEARVNEMFEKDHPHPPKPTLLDPAALYLTAIIESLCEHILSNVGRVAARDSSRASATVNDLFVALCEDDAIYGLFRTMQVYEQIEIMSKTPKARRSRSFSQNDRLSMSRTSSPQQEQTLLHSSSGSRSRQSSEGQLAIPMHASNSGSRGSFEKARAIKMFNNSNKSGMEPDIQSNHKRSESLRSENSRPFPDDESNPAEDAEMLREFDDLMRTSSTMKVSLTPDRLKTMEVYKQEKDQRGSARRPGTLASSDSQPQPDVLFRNPLPRHVDSIVEDDEEPPFIKGRTRQASVASPPTTSIIPPVPARSRSVSTSSGIPKHPARKPIRNASITAAPSSFGRTSSAEMHHARDFRGARQPDGNGYGGGFPPRTRVRQRNRDSLDLDDVMNGSDGEEEQMAPKPVRQPPRSPSTPKRGNGAAPVSAKTRELMDFLAEGPPETPATSKDGREFMNFLADGPPDFSGHTNDSVKPKGAGRLQRMISKLNLGNGGEKEKVKSPVEPPRFTQPFIPPTPPRPPVINSMQTYGSLSSLANRPIPPRPAPPLSPPSSPSQSHDSSDENKSPRSPPRKSYQSTTASRNPPALEKITSVPPSPMVAPAVNPDANPPEPAERARRPSAAPTTNGQASIPPPLHAPTPVKPLRDVVSDSHPVVPVRTFSNPPIRKPVPTIAPTTPSVISENDIRDMHRLFASATTADECRLIFDMFMARNGIAKAPKSQAVPYPSPTPSVMKHTIPGAADTSLESSIVELLLGGSAGQDRTTQPHLISRPMEGLPKDATRTLNSSVPSELSPIPSATLVGV